MATISHPSFSAGGFPSNFPLARLATSTAIGEGGIVSLHEEQSFPTYASAEAQSLAPPPFYSSIN